MNRRWGCGCGGCLGSSLLTLVLLLGLGYFLVYRPVQGFLAGLGTPPAQSQPQSSTAQPTALPSPSATVRPLTAAEVQRFVRVRRSVRAALGSSFVGTERAFRDLQNGQVPSLLTVLGVLRDASGSIQQGREAERAALAREGLSPVRYAELRAGVNRALGVPDIDFARAAASLRQGRLPDLSASVRPADERSRQLIAPFRQELLTTAPLGLLGL